MKRLKHIKIAEFRGFYEPETLILANPTGTAGSGLTIIVGPNNSGKTTVFEAIKKFCSDSIPQFDREERHPNKNVLLELENHSGETKRIYTQDSSVGAINGQDYYPVKSDFYIISSRRYFTTYFPADQIDHDQHRNMSINVSKSGVDSDFGRRMLHISSDPSLKEAFDNILKRLIPHFSSWNIELSRGENYIRYITGYGDEHSSELFGDGVTSLFKIAASLIAGSDSEILLIDEPELSLHPQAQKALATVLREYSTNKQILVTTHSPFFINWEDIENGAEIIRLNKPHDKRCTASSLDANVKKNLLNYTADWRKPQLLDTVAKEIFFAEKVVFVEGLEDMSLLTRFIKQEGISVNFEMFGYGSGGASNIKTLLKMAENLGIKAGAIFDGKEHALIKEAKQLFSSNFIIESISTDDIRDKGDKKIDGLFTESGDIKPRYVDELKEIIDRLNAHFG